MNHNELEKCLDLVALVLARAGVATPTIGKLLEMNRRLLGMVPVVEAVQKAKLAMASNLAEVETLLDDPSVDGGPAPTTPSLPSAPSTGSLPGVPVREHVGRPKAR
jgi:hypothetical protein